MTIEKKVALVTGASTGIGRAEVLALAKAGYDVAINYSRNAVEAEKTASLCSEAGADTLTIQADVALETDVVRMIEAVETKFKRLDVLCNNAGTTTTGLAWQFENIEVADWDRVFAVNVRGVFLVTKHAAKMLKKSQDSCIVITNSIVGARSGPQALPYSVSKGALWTMTKALAGALGRSGVRVNGVAPGWMEGDWMERMLGDNYDKLMSVRAKQTPLQKVVNAEDVAEAVMTLVNSNKSVTGQILVVDGGFSSVT